MCKLTHIQHGLNACHAVVEAKYLLLIIPRAEAFMYKAAGLARNIVSAQHECTLNQHNVISEHHAALPSGKILTD